MNITILENEPNTTVLNNLQAQVMFFWLFFCFFFKNKIQMKNQCCININCMF